MVAAVLWYVHKKAARYGIVGRRDHEGIGATAAGFLNFLMDKDSLLIRCLQRVSKVFKSGQNEMLMHAHAIM